MNTPAAPSKSDIWAVISKEITGIQLLWEAVEGIYFKQASPSGLALLDQDTPLLFRLMQTAMMESLLMRMSRLMDPAATGTKPNLSLKQLTSTDPELGPVVSGVCEAWDASTLKDVRNKYLSHNDLARSLTEKHTLAIPLSMGDVEAMRGLAAALRSLRRVVSQDVSGAPYLDGALDSQMSHEIDVLGRTIVAGSCFYRLLPEHGFLQEALATTEADVTRQINQKK